MFFLITCLTIVVTPEPIKCILNNPIKIEIKILDDDNNQVNGKIDFSVSPKTLCKIDGLTIIPERSGNGVLRVNAEYNGIKETKIVFINVSDTVYEIKKVIPEFLMLKVGESFIFKSTGNVSRWKVIPENIGYIDNNGNFVAKIEGRCRVIAVFDDGSVASARVVIGSEKLNIKILPSFVKLNIGDLFTFKTERIIDNIKWDVLPEDIGEINENGVFKAKKSGRGIIFVKGVLDGKDVYGRSIVFIKGDLTATILPKRVFLKEGEKINFIIKEQSGKEIKPVKWRVIPERMGEIVDGIFTPKVRLGKGKVVALLPEDYKPRVLYADFVITPEKSIEIRLRPKFQKINLDEKFQFYVDYININYIPLSFEVYPKDLGEISSSGLFTPKRNGSGVIIAKPLYSEPVKPAIAFVIVGNLDNLDISPKFIDIYENSEVKFNITSEIPPDAEIIWMIVPQGIGSISKDGYLKIGKLPQNQNELYIKVIAIAHKRLQIISYGSSVVRVRRR